MRFAGMTSELLPVKDVDRDQIRLLARREVLVVLRRERRTWIHTAREGFAVYYPPSDLMKWLDSDPFIQIGRHAVVNQRYLNTEIAMRNTMKPQRKMKIVIRIRNAWQPGARS
jgi:DNA-binding LytR/AlgR family response regulator